MEEVTNPSGCGVLHQAEDILAHIYITSAACMSLYAEALSFASAHHTRITTNPSMAKSIVVLSCQVTDLAILNDLKIAERLRDENPDAKVYICGCLARRFDISFPDRIWRLDHLREDFYPIIRKELVHYERPFWAPEFEEGQGEMEDGNLFRGQYPLRIGVGCHRNCTYCTIRYTRGKNYELPTSDKRIIEEFLNHKDVLLIADSPSTQQITDWYHLALGTKKPFSIRNVEPQIAMRVMPMLIQLADEGLLRIFHSPVQSDHYETLLDMRRHADMTLHYLDEVPNLQKRGVKVATNIITDYKGFPDPSSRVWNMFDYISWNPYWDGRWDREKAEQRWKKYFGEK